MVPMTRLIGPGICRGPSGVGVPVDGMRAFFRRVPDRTLHGTSEFRFEAAIVVLLKNYSLGVHALAVGSTKTPAAALIDDGPFNLVGVEASDSSMIFNSTSE